MPADVQSNVTKSIAVKHSEKQCNSCKFSLIQAGAIQYSLMQCKEIYSSIKLSNAI